MAVLIGSARGDEHGGAKNGQAGDQTGRELSTQNWYKSDKGWVVLRAKDPDKRTKIAANMRAACANPNIGYDQGQRNTLYAVAKPVGFDCSKVDELCEADCSSLVRVHCEYAGIHVDTAFTTRNQVDVLMATGEFDLLTDAQYTDQSAYLLTGDILVTRTQGHTVVVLTDGPKAAQTISATPELRRGMAGEAVKRAQDRLIAHGHKLPLYGADKDFGAETEAAVKAFQQAKRLEVDGVIGPLTWSALEAMPALTAVYAYTLRSEDAALLERLQALCGGTIAKA